MEFLVETSVLTSLETQAREAAALLKMMANERRLLVLCHLSESGELSVGQLQDRLELSQSALSQHLAKLRDEGLVSTRRESQSVYYRVNDPRTGQILALLHDIFCPGLKNSEQRN